MADRGIPGDAAQLRGSEGGDEGQALLDLGVHSLEKGDLGAAETTFKLADAHGSAAAAVRLGRLLEDRGDLEAAKAAYRRADERGSAEGAFFLGGILKDGDDLSGAEAAFRRADERGNADGANDLGVVLEWRGDPEAAEAAYRRADERGSAEGARNVGVFRQLCGDLPGAEGAYRRADRRGLADGALRLGLILHQRGDLPAAEAAFRRADERGSADGACNLGIVLEQRGDLEAAEAAFRQADELGNVVGTRGLVRVLVKYAGLEPAGRAFQEAAEGPDAERAFNAAVGLGQVLKDLNMPVDAEEPARRAAEIKPDSAEALWLLATILTIQGRAGDAESVLRAAIALSAADRASSGEAAPPQKEKHPPQARGSVAPRLPKPFQRLAGRLKSVFSRSPAAPDDHAVALKALKELADNLTIGFARMIAGHQVSDFAATQELLQRLSIGLSPLLTAGYAYRPNFGNYGQMSILGNIGEPVTIEVRYTDSSVRENRTAQQMAQRPRQARMVARTEPPYTRASSANFIIVHGRPAPAVVRTGYTGEEEAIHGPPWPATMKLSAATHEPNAGRLCATAQCQRTRIGRSDHCLAHVGQAGLSHAVREHTGTIDARRMSISAEILDAIKAGPLVKPIWFDEATFESPVDFSGCRFMAPISFEYASFKDTVSFDEAAFTQLTSFGGSCFHSQATFNRTRFHAAALFDAVRFISGVSFATGTFHGGASFAGAHFLASCNFNSCSFRTDVHSIFTTYLCGAVTFSGALFAWPPDFGPVLVNGVCDLAAAKFASESLVTLQITCDAASLEDTEFVGGVDLLVSPPCDVILDGAVFAKESVLTTWRDAQFPEAFEAQQRNPEARARLVSVRNARMALLRLDDVDLRACHFDGAQGLDTARIEGTDVFATPPGWWRVQRPVLAEEWAWRSYSRRGGPKLIRTGPVTRIVPPSSQRGWAVIPDECTAPSRLADSPGPIPRQRIVSIYRELRKGREDNRDQLNAADFYYSEMEMRCQHDHSSVLGPERGRPWAEHALLRGFWAISGYDVRPVRSLAALAVVVAGSAAVLAEWGYKQGTSFGHAVITALTAITALLTTLDWSLLTPVGQITEIFLKVAGPILLALTALGIRARARR